MDKSENILKGLLLMHAVILIGSDPKPIQLGVKTQLSFESQPQNWIFLLGRMDSLYLLFTPDDPCVESDGVSEFLAISTLRNRLHQ